jgi:hypothetical protein
VRCSHFQQKGSTVPRTVLYVLYCTAKVAEDLLVREDRFITVRTLQYVGSTQYRGWDGSDGMDRSVSPYSSPATPTVLPYTYTYITYSYSYKLILLYFRNSEYMFLKSKCRKFQERVG